MLRAGSLFYALAIAVIIALICSGVLLAASMNRIAMVNDVSSEELIRNANSGMEILLSDEMTGELDLFGRGMDSVRLEKKNWGAFQIAVSTAHRRNQSFRLISMTGWQCDENDRTALVLADLDRPLSVSGKTELRGDCYLPEAGIKRAYIEGESYSGDKLVYGQIKKADRFLPKYNDSLVKQISALFSFSPGIQDSVLPYETFLTSDSIANSFLNPVLYIRSAQAISIGEKIICGQVCIISAKAIRVGENSHIENAILIAPQIFIEEKAEGQFQAFARDSLHVEKNVRLNYPSVLGLIADKNAPENAVVEFQEETFLAGQVFACTTSPDFRKHVLIRIEKKAVVYGYVYSSDLADLQGEIIGDLVCATFELKTNSAVYENHLLNAVIDRNKRSADFTGSALVRKKNDHAEIVQWLQ